MFDGRYGFTQAGLETGGIEGFDYFRPILVAHRAGSGLACITMVEPQVCGILLGQRHFTETAHDFTMSADLVPGTTFCGRARLVVRNIGQFPQAAAVLDNAWQEFCNDLHLAGHCSAHPPPTRGDTGGHVAKQGEGPTVYEQEHD
jgi:hypothetical protein